MNTKWQSLIAWETFGTAFHFGYLRAVLRFPYPHSRFLSFPLFFVSLT